MSEEVNPIDPDHYGRGVYEARKVIRAFDLNFNMGAAVKYILRCGKKDDPIQELEKAKKFLEFEIEALQLIAAGARGAQSLSGKVIPVIPDNWRWIGDNVIQRTDGDKMVYDPDGADADGRYPWHLPGSVGRWSSPETRNELTPLRVTQ